MIKKNILAFTIIAVILATDISVFININFLRQVFSVIFLTVIPGYLILSIMKLDKLNLLKKLILIVGLSISFVMFYGLLINFICLSVGNFHPLQDITLILLFNIAFLLLFVIQFKMNNTQFITLGISNLKIRDILNVSCFLILPSLSIFGAYLMRVYNINTILLIGYLLIFSILVIITLIKDKVPTYIFPVAIFSIGIFCTLAFTLRSDYIVGADVHGEYYLFRSTVENMYWSIIGYTALNSCFSISLLPAIYQSLMNIGDLTLFYKLFYSLLIPILPLCVYEISRKYVNSLYSFYAAILVAANHVFIWTAANPRTNMAILFFGIFIMVLTTDFKSYLNKSLLLIIFISSIIVSHYTTAYIVFFILLSLWAVLKMISFKANVSENISIFIIIIFGIFIFLWYSIITKAAFDYSAIGFFTESVNSLPSMFDIGLRKGATAEVLGQGASYTLPRLIHIATQWSIILIIFIGMLFTLLKINISELKINIKLQYLLLSLLCFGMLVAILIDPQGSNGMGTDRAYLAMLVVLSLFFIIGCLYIQKYTKISPILLMLIILILIFASYGGLLYQLFNVPYDPTLTSEGVLYDTYYIQENEMAAAKWTFNNYHSYNTLYYISYGAQNSFRDLVTANSDFTTKYYDLTKNNKFSGIGYLYITQITSTSGIFIDESSQEHNFSRYNSILYNMNNIYNNGGTRLYLKTN